MQYPKYHIDITIAMFSILFYTDAPNPYEILNNPKLIFWDVLHVQYTRNK